jgi:hypothetical protein
VSHFRQKATAPLQTEQGERLLPRMAPRERLSAGKVAFERPDPRTAMRSTPTLRRRLPGRILARGLNAPQTHRLVRPPGTRQSRGSGSVEVAAIGRTERRPSPAAGRFGLPMRFLARKPPSPHRWRANHRPLRSRTLESALQSVSECPFSGCLQGFGAGAVRESACPAVTERERPPPQPPQGPPSRNSSRSPRGLSPTTGAGSRQS